MRKGNRIIAVILSLWVVFVPYNFTFVSAQDLGTEIGQQLQSGGKGMGTTQAMDPRVTAVLIIRSLLKLVGLIVFCLIMYAGFLWMTAAGDEGKIDTAKTILRNAIIGLAIVIMAYSITIFVIYSLTGYGPFGIPGLPPGGPGNLPIPKVSF
jgi:hypothetical protein